MILQALHSYYERLAAQDDSDVAREGFAPQSVSFALQLGEGGELLNIIDLREPAAKGKKLVARKMISPALGKARTVGIEPNFLWDGPGYVLGRDDKGKPDRTAKCQEAFRKLHEELLSTVDAPEAKALLRFLQAPPANHPKIEEKWADMATANLVFRVGHDYLHEMPALRAIWSARQQQDSTEDSAGVCLVTGEHTAVASLHTPIKGVAGAQSSGAALCSYNLQAFESFNKKQNLNGPVGRFAAFGYTTALNYLLRHPSQSLRLGAATAICWAERESPLENNLFTLFGGADTDKPASMSSSEPQESSLPGGAETGKPPVTDLLSAQERANVLRRLGQGLPVTQAWPGLDPGVKLFVLALKPNASRLSVSFFLQGEAQEFLQHIHMYYGNLAIVRRFDSEPEFPSVWRLAREVLGPHKKTGDIERLGAEVLEAALAGQAYPSYLLPMCLQRLRSGDDITSVRAGLIKAMLVRNYHHKEELMSLNPNHPSQAYQLGRLFALLAGVQRKAIGPNINADIRAKYYGAASATPAMVFPLLLRNAQNHISKAKAYGYDKLIRDVLNTINNAFPAHLDLQAQGLFALGYYHQRADKSVRSDDDATPEASSATEQE